ncbi:MULTISPECIES: aspartate/glutamate racemase family protein [unclassified Diaminobutyricimonas]|uniref:aspartate/glutamate racemase family protein n=1 Tax=unclassified Diaminobutyricimonas TaxID=2643261 RepID=UPI0012F4FFF3|nr:MULTISPECIES: aspartate/glutamate racemase family protein [unclassified Diaminobutyricimonas]
MTRIGIINAADSALALAKQHLRDDLPAAAPWALLDDRLLPDLAQGVDSGARLKDMALTLSSGGVDAIWLTCSSFPETVEEIRQVVGVPVTGPDELMFDALAEAEVTHLTIVYSADAARPAVEYHLKRTGLAQAARIDWVRCQGDPASGLGDRAEAEALEASVAGGSQRIVLAQYSLAVLAEPLQNTYGLPIDWGLPYAIDFLRQAPERNETK